MQSTIYTIGHSTRSISDFIQILDTFGIELVADIRTVPKSRHNPQYGQDALQKSLEAHKKSYIQLEGLGGLRKTLPDSVNTAWRNLSFRGYADYMQTTQFSKSIDKLIEIAAKKCVVIMCAEAVPWRCHRSLVGDALLVRGCAVEDIMSEKTSKQHKMTSFAHVVGQTITYPASQYESSS